VYDEAKRFQESITMAYHTFHGLETKCTLYLILMDQECDLMMEELFLHLLARLCSEDLTIFDGMQTRSFAM
jgi:dTDP-glucose 4,6-dehydratase